jgi:glycine cleavage system H protein
VVGRLYAPVSGKVAAFNAELEDRPDIINQDCYGAGWILKIEPGNLKAELQNLMQGKSYQDWIWRQLNGQCG